MGSARGRRGFWEGLDAGLEGIADAGPLTSITTVAAHETREEAQHVAPAVGAHAPAFVVSDLGLEEGDGVSLDHLVQVLEHSQGLGVEGSIARQVLHAGKLLEMGLLFGVSGEESKEEGITSSLELAAIPTLNHFDC